MKGSSGSTTTVQKADPWSGVQPGLLQLYQSALGQFQGTGPQYYPGSTVAPQSPVTQQGQQLVYDLATSPNPINNIANQGLYSTIAGDYLNAGPGTQDLYNFAGTNMAYQNPAVQDLYRSTGQDFWGGTPGMSELMGTAQGGMLNANPYLDAMFERASQAVGKQFSKNVMPGVASMFSGAGRYGSNQMAEGLDQAQLQYGNTLNNLATDIYGSNYAQERGLQQQAQGQLGQFSLANMGQKQAALGQVGQLGNAGQALMQSAASDLNTNYARERALQMQGLSMSPSIDQANYFGPAQLLGLGGQQDAYTQNIINSDVNRWNYGQQLPNSMLQQLSSLLNGYPSGSSTTQSQPQNPLLQGLGALNMLGSIGNNFGLFGGGASAIAPAALAFDTATMASPNILALAGLL